MTKLQAIREFMTFVCEQPITSARDKCDFGNWAMDIANSTPRIKLPKTLDYPHDYSDIVFRKNFISLCPSAKGFSHITLTILHECGHWATRSVMDIVEYDKLASVAYTQEMYMANPWEMLATQWAVCWLCSPSNRKVAKDFERKYFGH